MNARPSYSLPRRCMPMEEFYTWVVQRYRQEGTLLSMLNAAEIEESEDLGLDWDCEVGAWSIIIDESMEGTDLISEVLDRQTGEKVRIPEFKIKVQDVGTEVKLLNNYHREETVLWKKSTGMKQPLLPLLSAREVLHGT